MTGDEKGPAWPSPELAVQQREEWALFLRDGLRPAERRAKEEGEAKS